jgi:baculoviral IAP repeat-containing protein 6 (apollon)
LLDTVFQTSFKQNQVVMPNMKTLELNAFEAKGLLNALKQIESENVNGLDEIINQLKQQQQQIATFDSSSSLSSGSTDQWTTVRITDTYSNLLTILTQSLDEIKRTNIQSVAIQTISILLDRLYRLDYTLVETQLNNTIGVPFSNFDKRYMCSETTRRATYNQWPHMDYKWVLPDALAQAGFFHQPTHPGDDRTICFACDLCLVAWEQQDQPWYIYLLKIFLKKRFKIEKIRVNLKKIF